MPLTGIKVLDLTRLLPFGYGSMLLADMGAEVIKIEEPTMGDYMRWIPPVNIKENYVFLSTNRNKKSVSLNLKEEEGRDIFCRLATKADVIFESFRPGIVKKLGIDYERIKKINPQIVYCSCSGFGQTGPYSQRAGHDINYLGISGVLGVCGRHLDAPVVPGVPVADMTSGVFCALSICAALAGRVNSKEGKYIDISMTDCMVSYMHVYGAALFGKSPEILPINGGHGRYETFETKDGRFITLGNVEDKFWQNLCDLIDREDLKKYPFEKTSKDKEMLSELRDLFRTKTREEWLSLLDGKDICYGPVNEIDEIFSDPQIKARNMYIEVDHPVEGKIGQIGSPIKFEGESLTVRCPPPRLGENTDEILQECGYSKEEIDKYRKAKII